MENPWEFELKKWKDFHHFLDFFYGDSPRIVDVHSSYMENIMGDNGKMSWTYGKTMGMQWDIMGI